jgi:hypothetical protein
VLTKASSNLTGRSVTLSQRYFYVNVRKEAISSSQNLFFYLQIYALLNDAVSSSDDIVTNNMMINK